MTSRMIERFPEWLYHSETIPEESVDIPLLSNSIAKEMVNGCPRDAWARHPKLGGRKVEPTDAMIKGSALHAIMAPWGAPEIVEVPFDSYRKKDAQALRDEALEAGHLPLLTKHLTEVHQSVDTLRRELADHRIELDGFAEITLLWDELHFDGSLVRCRARLDHLKVEGKVATIWDFKRGVATDPDTLSRRLGEDSYAMQPAAYGSAVRAHFPDVEEVRWRWLCIDEVKLTVAEPDPDALDFGERQWSWAVGKWAQCLKEDAWPGYCQPGEVVSVGLKPWARKKWAERIGAVEEAAAE